MSGNTDIYVCGLCKAELTVSLYEIGEHDCVVGYRHCYVSEDENTQVKTFWPKENDGSILYNVPDESANEKENVASNEQNSSTKAGFAVLEEILIDLVRERPPLWNYKDCPPKDRTNAARNILWEDVRQISDPNNDHPNYTVAFLKNKWKNLYDSYRAYLGKAKGKSGQAAKNRKQWKYMEQMSFVKELVDFGFKTTVTNLPSTSREDMEHDTSDIEDSETAVSAPPTKKKRMSYSYLEKMVEAILKPLLPPPVITLPQPPPPVELDEINHCCLALDKKMHGISKEKTDLAMLEIAKIMHKIIYS